MNWFRKLSALFFVSLLLFVSATFYITEKPGLVNTWQSKQQAHWYLTELAANYPVLFQKNAASGNIGWNSISKIPGFVHLRETLEIKTPLTVFRKIYLVAPGIYSPCKYLLIYPFHEFF